MIHNDDGCGLLLHTFTRMLQCLRTSQPLWPCTPADTQRVTTAKALPYELAQLYLTNQFGVDTLTAGACAASDIALKLDTGHARSVGKQAPVRWCRDWQQIACHNRSPVC